MPLASKATSEDKGKFEASVKGFIIGAVLEGVAPPRAGQPRLPPTCLPGNPSLLLVYPKPTPYPCVCCVLYVLLCC